MSFHLSWRIALPDALSAVTKEIFFLGSLEEEAPNDGGSIQPWTRDQQKGERKFDIC